MKKINQQVAGANMESGGKGGGYTFNEQAQSVTKRNRMRAGKRVVQSYGLPPSRKLESDALSNKQAGIFIAQFCCLLHF